MWFITHLYLQIPTENHLVQRKTKTLSVLDMNCTSTSHYPYGSHRALQVLIFGIAIIVSYDLFTTWILSISEFPFLTFFIILRKHFAWFGWKYWSLADFVTSNGNCLRNTLHSTVWPEQIWIKSKKSPFSDLTLKNFKSSFF